MKSTAIQVENNDVLGSVRSFLRQLMDSGFVDALLVPRLLPSGDGYAQSLVKDTASLADANPFAPTMPVQSARILSDLTSNLSAGRVGVVLKPCEMRAAVELVKFLQVNLDNVVTIGVDCMGTYEVRDFAKMGEETRAAAVQSLIGGGGNGAVRENCRACEYPTPMGTDLTLGLLGSDVSQALALVVGERVEAEVAEKLTLELNDGEPAGRKDAVAQLVAQRKAVRDQLHSDLKERASSLDKLLGILSACIRCHNCMNACPICYCKECVFQSAVFEHRSDQFLKWAERKGSVRMPTDTLIFHLTRMGHMATSCVNCGMCTSACPSELPIAELFGLMGSELQEMFEYLPGRDPAEEPPVSVFKEDELKSVAAE